ncbi:MFS transporter [Chloroflexota bacterium]
MARRKRIFYGYWIIAVCFACLFVTAGFGFFSFGLFIKPLEADFGWNRGEITGALSIYFIVIAIAAPFVGRLVQRYGARITITAGALVTGIGFTLLSQTQSLWYFYLSYAVTGMGIALMGHIATSTVVSSWFNKRRGTAIGIMSSGLGAGTFVMPPIIGGYLIPAFGWGTSYMVLGVLVWILIIPATLVLMKSKPSDMGLFPDGSKSVLEDTKALALLPTSKGLGLKKIIATPAFWFIAASYFLGSFSIGSVIQTHAPHLEDMGFPVALAAGALGAIGVFNLMGKFAFGWLCDRMLAKHVWVIGLTFALLGIIFLMSVRPDSPTALIWLYAILIGFSAGSWLPAMSMIISRRFGLTSYSSVYGLVALAQSLGLAIGPFVVGYLYDSMGNYDSAFITLIVLIVVAMPAILAVRKHKPR